MIKVGLFIDTYYPMVDGVINVVHNYASRMNDGQFEVTVFCPIHDKKYVDDFGYRVVRCNGFKVSFLDYRAPTPRLDRKFKKILKESDLDIVHIHSPFAVGSMGVRYAKKHNIPVIATMHSQFKKDFLRATHSRLLTKILLGSVMKVFNRCTEYYAVNDAVAEIFYGYGAKHRPLVLNNSTDFRPVEDRAKACALVNSTFGIPEDTPLFVFVGRITILKNVFFIADALAAFKDKNFKMLFIGDGLDMPALKKRVDELGITQNVIFAGKITDKELLKAAYCRAELFLFPSLYDASSLVQIEAASQKTPTMFIEGAATASAVKDGVNGFVAPATPEEYAKKIESVLGDKQLYERVSEGAYRDLYRHWDDTVREVKSIYLEKIRAQGAKK